MAEAALFREFQLSGHIWAATRILLRVLALGAASVPSVSAQQAPTLNYTSYDAIPGRTIEIGYYGSANKNCVPAPPPAIRVSEAPQSGTLTVRGGSLTTDRVKGCPGLKLPIQILFYVARPDAAGSDHLRYVVTSQNGDVSGYDVTIRIHSAPREGDSSPEKSL